MTYYANNGMHEFTVQISLSTTTGDSFTHDMRLFADQILNISVTADNAGVNTIPIEIPMKSSAIKGFAVSGTRAINDLEFRDASNNVLADFDDIITEDADNLPDTSLAIEAFGVFDAADGPLSGISQKFNQIFDLSTSAFTSGSTADVKKIVFTPQLNASADPEDYQFVILYDNVD